MLDASVNTTSSTIVFFLLLDELVNVIVDENFCAGK